MGFRKFYIPNHPSLAQINGYLNNNIKKLENTEILVLLRDLSINEYYYKILASVHNSEIIGIDTKNNY